MNQSNGHNDVVISNQTYIIHELSDDSQIINAVISFLAIVLNVGVAYCLHKNRSRFPIVLWYQLITLSYSDAFAGGLQSLWLLFKVKAINTSAAACGAIQLTYHTAQLAAILNLFQLSVKRFCVIRSSSAAWRKRLGPSTYVGCGLASWVMSCLFIYPAAGWLAAGPHIDGCLSPSLFGSPEQTLVIWIYDTMLIGIIMFLLNVFHVLALCSLHRGRRRLGLVQPVPGPQQSGSMESGDSSSDENGQKTFGRAQRHAFRHLCALLVMYNATIAPYVIVTSLFVTGTVLYDPAWPVVDIHLLSLNSVTGAVINIWFCKQLRKCVVMFFVPNNA